MDPVITTALLDLPAMMRFAAIMPAADRYLMVSLTFPHVAATLAAALVAYQTQNAASVRLIDDSMLNSILVVVVVTSVLGPILTERFLGSLEPRRAPETLSASPPLKEAV